MLNNCDLIIFDLDGTIVDSALDFDAMRAEMGLQKGRPILEELEKLKADPLIQKYWDIVEKHELDGAMKATLMPGIDKLLDIIRTKKLKSAILTRNCQKAVDITLAKIPHTFDLVISRNHDLRPKPYPDGLLSICAKLNSNIAQSVYIGDYLFDLEAARAAQMKSVLYAPETKTFESYADYVIRHFDEIIELLG